MASNLKKQHQRVLKPSENLLTSNAEVSAKAREKFDAEHINSFKIENVEPEKVEKEKIKFCNKYGFPIHRVYDRAGISAIRSYVIFSYNETTKVLSALW